MWVTGSSGAVRHRGGGGPATQPVFICDFGADDEDALVAWTRLFATPAQSHFLARACSSRRVCVVCVEQLARLLGTARGSVAGGVAGVRSKLL